MIKTSALVGWTIAVTGVAVGAGLGVREYRRRVVRAKVRDLLAHAAGVMKGSSFKIPRLKTKAVSTFAEQLDEYLRAYLVLSETLAVQAKENTFEFSIEMSRSMSAPGTYGRKHGPRNPGLLYSAVPWFMTAGQKIEALYGRSLWDEQPAITVLRAEGLFNRAIVVAEILEEWGTPIKLGAGGNGPTVGEMVEDYAQDAAVSYLAGAIPGGAIVLAIAELGGFGWTNTSGRREIPKGADIPNDRLNAIGGAEDLIGYAYAHPAPASAYPSGKLP